MELLALVQSIAVVLFIVTGLLLLCFTGIFGTFDTVDYCKYNAPTKELIVVYKRTGPELFIGSGTVWHRPSGRRCSTSKEITLSKYWEYCK